MNAKKQRVEVNRIFFWLAWSLFVKGGGFGICPFAETFCFDEDDNIKEEGAEDKDDATENPNGEGSQSGPGWGAGRWGKGRVERVHQYLDGGW